MSKIRLGIRVIPRDKRQTNMEVIGKYILDAKVCNGCEEIGHIRKLFPQGPQGYKNDIQKY